MVMLSLIKIHIILSGMYLVLRFVMNKTVLFILFSRYTQILLFLCSATPLDLVWFYDMDTPFD